MGSFIKYVIIIFSVIEPSLITSNVSNWQTPSPSKKALTYIIDVPFPPVDLYLNFEKSSLKNQVRRTGFFFSKLIFAGSTGSKNQVRNRLKIQFVELDFSETKYRSTRGKDLYTVVNCQVLATFNTDH